MSKRIAIMAIAAAVWIAISAYLIHRYIITGTPLNLRTLFPVIASGIIIFVPLYKKYFRNTETNNGSTPNKKRK